MRKNLTSIFAILMVFILMNTPASASRTLFDTDQVCNIEGTIQSVEFKEAYRDPCLDDNSCPVGAYNPNRPETHYLKILLSFVSCEPDKSKAPHSYQSQFPLEEEVEIYVNENRISKGQIENNLPFEPGQKISGQVEYFSGHAFASYEIEKQGINIQRSGKNLMHALTPIIALIIFLGFIFLPLYLRKRNK